MPRPPSRALATALLALATTCTQAQARKPRPKPEAEAAPLSMSRAIACESVAGFDDYEPRPSPSLTADEKLLIYYEPRHFATEKDGPRYRAHFVQDARVRSATARNASGRRTRSSIMTPSPTRPRPAST